MGLLEQIKELSSAMHDVLDVSLQVEESQIRINKLIKENVMDATQFLAAVKEIHVEVTAVGTRMDEMAKVISDNPKDTPEFDAALKSLQDDAATLKLFATRTIAPAPVVPVEPQGGQGV